MSNHFGATEIARAFLASKPCKVKQTRVWVLPDETRLVYYNTILAVLRDGAVCFPRGVQSTSQSSLRRINAVLAELNIKPRFYIKNFVLQFGDAAAPAFVFIDTRSKQITKP